MIQTASSIPAQVIPARLSPGDTIGIISPAAPTVESPETPPDAFEKGIALLEAAGFRVKLFPHARNKTAYLAGTDAERLADLHDAFRDPQVRAILCARGGYGCTRLLPQINWDMIRRHPKIFVGFSDITALHLAFYQRTGLVGFYGPMLTSNLIHNEPYSQQTLFDLLCGRTPIPFSVPNRDPYTCFHSGIAEGPLTGGNLSLLTALCGTPYQPVTAGHILFIEDWKEKYYSLDRQFQQLQQAGLLDHIRGLLLCDFSQIEPEPDFDLTELLRRLTAHLQVPVGYGFSVGHGDETATLPIGIRARFDAGSGTLILLEPAVL